MKKRVFASNHPALVSLSVVALLGLGLADSEASAKSRKAKYREDVRTCESFGATYGTPAFTDCMLDQQRRRDAKKLQSIEETRMLSDLAKDGQIMAERARRQRCDRDPDRRECGPR